MKHKHADLIHAWADGAQIQIHSSRNDEWVDAISPAWDVFTTYRIKPEPKPDVVRKVTVEATSLDGAEFIQIYKTSRFLQSNLHLTFDGETGKLKKAEVL